jgi:predicted phage terminase large subunit-like protein
MRMAFPTLKRAAKELYERFKPRKVVIEDKASGTSLIQELKREGLYGVEPYQPSPGSDKYMRTAGQSMKFESGQVLLPTNAPWLDDYVRELTGFPGAKFDDQVDSTTQALDFMSSKLCRLTIYDVV